MRLIIVTPSEQLYSPLHIFLGKTLDQMYTTYYREQNAELIDFILTLRYRKTEHKYYTRQCKIRYNFIIILVRRETHMHNVNMVMHGLAIDPCPYLTCSTMLVREFQRQDFRDHFL